MHVWRDRDVVTRWWLDGRRKPMLHVKKDNDNDGNMTTEPYLLTYSTKNAKLESPLDVPLHTYSIL